MNASLPRLQQRILLGSLLREFILFARWHALSAIILTLLVSALEGAGLMLLVPMLELAGVTGSALHGSGSHFFSVFSTLGLTPSLMTVLCIYVGLITAHSVLSWKRDVLTNELQLSFVDHLRQRLFDCIGATEWAFLARTHSAEFSHALTVDIGRVEDAIFMWLQIVTIGTITLGYVATALYLSPPITLVTLGMGCVLLLMLRRRHQNSFNLGEGLTQTTQRVHQHIAEYLAGLKLAKSGNVEKRLSAVFAEGMQQAREYAVEFTRKHSAAQGFFRIGGAGLLCVLVYVALAIAAVPVASVLALAFIFARLFPQLSQIQQSYEQLLHALPAYSAYSAMSDRCKQAVEPDTGGSPYTFTNEIRLEAVSYCPANSKDNIVSDVSLVIPACSTTALIGPSGAGKSTLADLLAGLLAPTGGRIVIDSRELNDRRAWRQRVAYVPQETFLLNASVRENLLWTMPEASDETVWEALEQAAAAEFVRALPQGLNTVLGERGIRLSGGERQRLAIARALMRKPILLVLDEATSALDRENELHIQTTLSKLHRHLTILLIAHRPATILCADQVVSLQYGRLVKTDVRPNV